MFSDRGADSVVRPVEPSAAGHRNHVLGSGVGLVDTGRARAVTAELALLLAQDGIANGAIYVLVALGIVLTFLVTRVIFVPFGDLVAYAALTLAALQEGRRPGTLWLVLVLVAVAFAFEAGALIRAGAYHRLGRAALRAREVFGPRLNGRGVKRVAHRPHLEKNGVEMQLRRAIQQ